MNEEQLLFEIDSRGTATLTLNRPEVHNAINQHLIASLIDRLQAIDRNDSILNVVLRANGPTFSAGADLNWMKSMADYSQSDNFADAMGLANLMRTLDRLSKPTVAVVHGPAFGGGVGLVACCDIAIAGKRASFWLPEVQLGLIPAVISPYLVNAIGARATRRYFLTAERIKAIEAKRLGLVHEVVPQSKLEATVERITNALRRGGPKAQVAAKRMIETVNSMPVDDRLIEETAHRIAHIRCSEEAQEGLKAFLEKQEPSWRA